MSFFRMLADCIGWPLLFRSNRRNNNSDNSKQQPLLDPTTVAEVGKYYDPSCLLSLPPEILIGYLILLGQNPHSSTTACSSSSTPATSQPPPPSMMSKDDDDEDDNNDDDNTTTPTDVDSESISLAFLAITDGNVVDACFGAAHMEDAHHYKETPAYRLAKAAKEEIREAAEGMEEDVVQHVSVQAYRQAFSVALDCRRELDRSRVVVVLCFRQGRIQKRAKLALVEAFVPLAECIQQAKTL